MAETYLVTDTDVLVQEEGTQMWRSVASQDTGRDAEVQAASLRALRREQARRVHPAGSAHRSASLEIYNPLTSSWAAIPPVGARAQVGDALCSRLPDGRVLIYLSGRAASGPCALYDPVTNQWSTAPGQPPAGPRRKGGAVPAVIAVRRNE